ncbi:uncharacterized protein LOC121739004 [Aricia agestis]|uniref:uncharacterized protein LOC121739004 n=1 Tax=Aricia agestis TaxID=91739 RepID=UPI001C204E63|nr:uncharacterized protein LOC121739004 [Aricia agestis]
MFKFVVLCALIGAAVAEPEPGAVFSSYAYPGAYLSSAPAYIPSAYSNVVYNSPLVQPTYSTYSAPLAHLIKKRSVLVGSPALTTYAAAPYATSYAAAYPAISPLATSYAAAIPTTYSSPLFTTAHLIKKRSAPLIVPSAYSAISPLATGYAATGSFYTPTIGAASYISSPYVSSLPLAYGAPFIKK